MKKFVFGFIVALVTVCLIAGAPFVRTDGDPQIEGNVTIHGNLTTVGNMETAGDLIVDGGEIGITGDLDLLSLAAAALTINGDTTITNAGGSSNSYKLKLAARWATGPETQTSSLYTAYGADPYMIIATPNATGVETDVVHLDTVSLRFANDNTTDIGANGANRPKNIYTSGLVSVGASLSVQSNIVSNTGDITSTAGAITANTNITADTGDIIATAGDMNAVGGFAHQLSYWYQDDVADSQTDAALDMDGNSARAEVPTIRAGSIIGIAVYSNEARSAGTLTVDATVDGTKTGLTAVLDGTNSQTKVTTQAKDTDTFTAGQRIGVKLTTDGSWAPTTADITVTVLIEQ